MKQPSDLFSPKKDFYQYVNNEWLSTHKMPDSESRWGTFDLIIEKTSKQLRRICEDALKDKKAEKGSNTQIIRDFYASGMDMKKRDAEGIEPLRNLLVEIDSIKTFEEVIQMIAKLQQIGIHPFFVAGFDKDVKDPNTASLYIWQGGLNMPDRDYYLEKSEDMQKNRDSYMKHITKILRLAGFSKTNADKVTTLIYNIELNLAESSRTKELTREIDKNYYKYTIAKAEKEFAIFRAGYLNYIGGSHLKDLIIQQPEFLTEVERIISSDIDATKIYLKWNVLNKSANYLNKKFSDASFNFYGKTLQGLKKQKPLWKKIIRVMQDKYGTPLTEALGPLYIEKHFSPKAKTILYEMIKNVNECFKERVKKLDWMDAETKKLVFKKVDNIKFKLAYPDKWEDISKIGVDVLPFIQNQFKVESYEFNKRIKEAGGPANWDEWVMKPTIVNACADQMREMTFPAAFFQDVFFNPNGDMATNYGSAGSVMGHELSHFVDDQGSKYDADGKLNEWWPKEVRNAYEQGAKAFVDHYNKYSVEGVPVNGEYTQGENIGDVAGLMTAFDALQKYIKTNGDNKIINGLTPAQRFFIGYAKTECGHMRVERRKESYKTDPHAPSEVRVNAALSIVPAFVEAFDIKEGDNMYAAPETYPKLW